MSGDPEGTKKIFYKRCSYGHRFCYIILLRVEAEKILKYLTINPKIDACRRGNKSASTCETIHKNHDLLISLSFSFSQGVRTPWGNKKPRKNPGLNILASIAILFNWLIGFGSRCFSLDWDWLLLFLKGWIWFLLGYWFRCYLM